MGSIRLYSGDDGESHIEEIDPTTHPAWAPFTTPRSSCSGRRPRPFQRLARRSVAPVHNHPMRPGGDRVGRWNGLPPGAGDVNLTGYGHTTREVGDVPRVSVTVHLDQ